MQRAEYLLTLLLVAAQILLAVHHQRRRFGVVQIFDGGLVPVAVQVLPGRLAAPNVLEEEAHVRRRPEADGITDHPLGHGRFEAIRMANDPGGHVAAVAAAGDAHAGRIHVGQCRHVIGPGHHVGVIGLAPHFVNRFGVSLAVALTAARVGEGHHIPLRRQVVKFVHKGSAVLQPGAAVNLDDGRVMLAFVKAGRFDQPALQVVVVGPLVPDLLHRAQINLGQPVVVEVGQPLGRSVGHLAHPDLAGIGLAGVGVGQSLARLVLAEAVHNAVVHFQAQITAVGPDGA